MFYGYQMLDSAWDYKMELLDITSFGAIIEGITDFNLFKLRFRYLLDQDTRITQLSRTSLYITSTMTFRRFRDFKKDFEDSHYNVYSIFVKDKYFDELVTQISSQTTNSYKFSRKCFYLFVQARNDSSEFQPIEKAADFKVISSSPPCCIYGFKQFSDLLLSYSVIIKNKLNWPVFALTRLNLKTLRKMNSSSQIFDESEVIIKKNFSLAERSKNKFPSFSPFKYFCYIGFIEKVVQTPQRIRNVDEMFSIKDINDVQISHIYKEENGCTIRTFLGFESELRCLHVYDYFMHHENESESILNFILINGFKTIDFDVHHDLFYLEAPKNNNRNDKKYGCFDSSVLFSLNYVDFFENKSSFFYAFDNSDEFDFAIQFLNSTLNSNKKLLVRDLRLVDRDEFANRFDAQLSARMLKTKFFYLVFSLLNGSISELKSMLKAVKVTESSVNFKSKGKVMKCVLFGFPSSADREKAYSLLKENQNSQMIQSFVPEILSEAPDEELLKLRSALDSVEAQEQKEGAGKKKRRRRNRHHKKDKEAKIEQIQKSAATENTQATKDIKIAQKSQIDHLKETSLGVKSNKNDTTAKSGQNIQKEKDTKVQQNTNENGQKKDKEVTVKNSPNGQNSKPDKTTKPPQKETVTKADNKTVSSIQNEVNKSATTSTEKVNKLEPPKPPQLSPISSNSSSTVTAKKPTGPDCFSPNQNLIYFYFIEKEKARKISPGKQIKLTLFGVKKCKDVQRYKKIVDSITEEEGYFTFFGFEKFDEVEAGIDLIKSKWLSEGPVKIYELTSAFERHKQNPNDDDDLEQELFLQAIKEKNQNSSSQLQVTKARTLSINRIKVNIYNDINNQNEDFYCFSQTSVPTSIQFEIKKSLNKMKSIRNIVKDTVPHNLVYEPYTYIFVDLKDQLNDALFRNVFISHKIGMSDAEYETDTEDIHYVEYEEKVLPKAISDKLLYFLDLLGEVDEIKRNVFHNGKIVNMFFFKSFSADYVLNLIEKCLIEENCLFDLTKFSLKTTIYFNEDVMLQSKDDFNIIVNEIKSLGIVPINIERNKILFVKKPILANNLFQKFSFICFQTKEDKMNALNHINQILLKNKENVLKLNPSLHYIKIDTSKCFPSIIINPQILFINAINCMSGVLDVQQNVLSIECPIGLTYIGFSSKKLMYFYNKVLNFRLNYISLFPNTNFFKPDENLHYVRYQIKTEETLEDLLGRDVMSKVNEIQKNCTVFEKEIQFLTYLGFNDRSNRDSVVNMMTNFSMKYRDVLIFSIIDFDQDIDIYDPVDQMTSECIYNVVNDRILVNE